MNYIESKNIGLPTNFYIKDGKFFMQGGVDKVNDNLRMIILFLGWFRIFTQDFISGLLLLYQKDTSYIFKYKSMFRLNFINLCAKYAPNANVYGMDIPFDPLDRKSLFIDVQFTHKLDKVNEPKTVRFVRAL